MEEKRTSGDASEARGIREAVPCSVATIGSLAAEMEEKGTSGDAAFPAAPATSRAAPRPVVSIGFLGVRKLERLGSAI
jgi:hypothetical protein